MAKLPPKPLNIVHDYFPVGTDGHSPMHKAENLLYKIGPKDVEPGPTANEIAEELKDDTLTKKIDKDPTKKWGYRIQASEKLRQKLQNK